jgi:FixJ family two-component response regulator
MPSEPTVVLVDDNSDLRDSLAHWLRAAAFRTEGYANAEALLAVFDPDRAGCLIVDVYLDQMSGVNLQAELLRRGVRTPIIMTSGLASVSDIVEVIRAGAFDYLEKPIDRDVLVDCVRRALALDARLREFRRAQEATRQRLDSLTPREHQTMKLLLSGKNTKQIARELEISPKTVDNHRSMLMKKMRVDSSVELLQLMHTLETAAVGGGD